MLPAMSFDGREREKTATFARVGSTVGGSLVGVVIMPIVLFFSLDNSTGTGDNMGWFMFGFIVALTGIITALCVGIFTREKSDALRENKKETKGIVAVFKILGKNDQLLWTALAYILYCVGIYVVNSLELYYFQYIMGQPEGFSILQTINMFVGILSVGIFPVIVGKFGRKKIFFICFISLFAGLALFAVAESSMVLVLIAAELFFIPQPIVWLVVLMTITDSVEYGQLTLGHRDESLILSVRPLCDKFGSAISNGVVGQTAILAGMTTGASAASITFEGELMFKILMLAVPAAILLISLLVYMIKVKLDEKMHKEIMEKLSKS